MAVTILMNNIPEVHYKGTVEAVIREEIGDRPGQWNVRIMEFGDWAATHIRISGPNGFDWNGKFEGADEQDKRGSFIRETVREAMRTGT
jgi:hypothetical protein